MLIWKGDNQGIATTEGIQLNKHAHAEIRSNVTQDTTPTQHHLAATPLLDNGKGKNTSCGSTIFQASVDDGWSTMTQPDERHTLQTRDSHRTNPTS